MLNTTKTYLTFKLKDKDKKEYTYAFTGCNNYCVECKTNEPIYTMAQGGTNNYNNWLFLCYDHLSTVVVKQQMCNICNKKASTDTVNLCKKCYDGLWKNNIEMNNICKYPYVDMDICNCKYCQLRNKN